MKSQKYVLITHNISPNIARNAPRLVQHFCVAALICLSPVWAVAGPVAGQGTWEATLQARDINADGVVDAYYDTTQNVTWLVDAKALRGTAFDDGVNPNDGKATYASAKSWLAGLDVYGVTGWRFPGSDLLPMYTTTLGNSTIPNSPTTGWTNTGPFSGVPDFGISGWIWRGDTPMDDDGNPVTPEMTRILAADQLGAPFYIVATTSHYGAWAVKSGDVPVTPAIPEPSSWALLLGGLSAVGLGRAWRQRRGLSSLKIAL
jgi:hypothetical protein